MKDRLDKAELEDLDPLHTTAGYHDFDSIKIAAGYEGQTVVALHESIHDEMLRQTPDGSILVVLRLVQKYPKTQKAKSAAERWLRLLAKSSRRSQECAATYLSIKTFPPDTQARLLEEHPSKYKDYYEGLARYIETIFKPSYLQYLVAKNTIQAALASPLAERLRKWSPELDVSIFDDETPDHRLDLLLPALASKFHELREILANDVRANTVISADFDIQSEQS